jgi:prepilin-type N-terminal cleavage/methylation domain-containing protein
VHAVTALVPCSSHRSLASRGSDQQRARRGFTIIELLVAITLLAVGVLALAGMSAVVMYNVNGAAQQTIAATVAQARLERLRSANCASLAGTGAATRRGMTETWKVVNGSRTVTASVVVTYYDGRGKQTFTHRTIIPCPVLQ